MVAVRCKGCGKLLGFFDGEGDVKCPRSGCGCQNKFNTADMVPSKKKNSMSLKNRTTSSGVTLQ